MAEMNSIMQGIRAGINRRKRNEFPVPKKFQGSFLIARLSWPCVKRYTEEDMIAFAKRFVRECEKYKVTSFQVELYDKEKENG